MGLIFDSYMKLYHLVMTNSLPWKDPPCLRTVNHLFRLGPPKKHGKLLVITRGYIYVYIYHPFQLQFVGWFICGLISRYTNKEIARTWVFPGWEFNDGCNNQKGPWRRVTSNILLLVAKQKNIKMR